MLLLHTQLVTQIFTGVLSVHESGVALLSTSTLHTHQYDRADITTRLVLEGQRRRFQFLLLGMSQRQRVPPTALAFVDNIDRQLDHFLIFEVCSWYVDE